MRILLCIALICTLILATVKNQMTPFNFESATAEDRIAWLDRHVPRMEGEIAHSVRTSFGILSPIKVGHLETKASGSVNGYIEINKSDAAKDLAGIRRELKTALCPRYLKTQLSDQIVRVNLDFIDINDRRIGRLVLSPNNCSENVS